MSTFRDRVAEFLRQHEGQWLPATAFEAPGGRQAWRTRIAECRVQLGMNIENRVRLVKRQDGSTVKLSEYRYTVVGQMALGI